MLKKKPHPQLAADERRLDKLAKETWKQYVHFLGPDADTDYATDDIKLNDNDEVKKDMHGGVAMSDDDEEDVPSVAEEDDFHEDFSDDDNEDAYEATGDGLLGDIWPDDDAASESGADGAENDRSDDDDSDEDMGDGKDASTGKKKSIK